MGGVVPAIERGVAGMGGVCAKISTMGKRSSVWSAMKRRGMSGK